MSPMRTRAMRSLGKEVRQDIAWNHRRPLFEFLALAQGTDVRVVTLGLILAAAAADM